MHGPVRGHIRHIENRHSTPAAFHSSQINHFMLAHRTANLEPMQWRWGTLMRAPHRLAFAWAHIVLLCASFWWLTVQLTRAGWMPDGLEVTPWISSTVVHGVTMSFGFAPLFFCGFLFTAGPKWLGVEPPRAQDLLPATTLQGAGWVIWLWGAHHALWLALLGGAMAWLGLFLCHWRFISLLRNSPSGDMSHAVLIAMAGTMGLLSLAGVLGSLLVDDTDLARAWTQTGLWSYVVMVYVTVAHRMIPFFTSTALQQVTAWRPMWVLYFLVVAVLHKTVSVWFDHSGWHWPAWSVISSFWMLVTGLILLWLAFVWGLIQSMKIRLLAMLHIGFLWLGLGFLLDATGHFWTDMTGEAGWSLGAMHATTMGFMGSLLLAMVTRVSCGHGGRVLVADGFIWFAFLVLQLATWLRVAAAIMHNEYHALLTVLAAFCWLVATAPWAIRLFRWYGKPRTDGRPG